MEREKSVQIAFRLPPDIAKEFRVACAEQGVKMQTVLENAVKEFIKKKPE